MTRKVCATFYHFSCAIFVKCQAQFSNHFSSIFCMFSEHFTGISWNLFCYTVGFQTISSAFSLSFKALRTPFHEYFEDFFTYTQFFISEIMTLEHFITDKWRPPPPHLLSRNKGTARHLCELAPSQCNLEVMDPCRGYPTPDAFSNSRKG